jgi:two-component system chemotaxis response regulator CheY
MAKKKRSAPAPAATPEPASARSAKPESASAPAQAPPPKGSSLNILIVDDSATMRTLLRRVVDLAEVPVGEIYEASNGLEALEILEKCSVQALFTDINMPRMSGYDLLHEINRRQKWNDLLRIVVSTDGSTLRREEVKELNVNLYIQKPFRPEVVRNVLSRITTVLPH